MSSNESIKSVEIIEPKSSQGLVDFLRILLSIAMKEKILYIDISYKTDRTKRLQGFTSGDTSCLRD